MSFLTVQVSCLKFDPNFSLENKFDFFPLDVTEMNAGGRNVWLDEHRMLLS